LSRQLEIQRSQKSLDAQNLARQYSGEFDDIGRELDSWTSTGYRARGQALENQYARRMHELQMGQYDQAISDAQFTFGDFLYAGLTGAAQGMGFAAQINGLKEQSQSVKRGGGQPAPATDKTGGAIRYYDELYKR
jgi:hypothetical protein